MVWWLATAPPVYAGEDPVMYYTAWVLLMMAGGMLLFIYAFVGLIAVSWVFDNTLISRCWPWWGWALGCVVLGLFAPVTVLIGLLLLVRAV